MTNTNEQWSSKLGFIYATAGSAIGLGAIWKFPYIAGMSGGGAFFILFLLLTLFLGVPLLIGEYVLGRHTGKDAILTYKKLAPRSPYQLTGWLGVIACFLILSFYSVIGGWSLLYLGSSLTGQLSGLTLGESQNYFDNLIANPALALGAQLTFLLLAAFVVAKGIQKGIEKVSKWMIPSLLVLLVILAVYSLTLDGAAEGIRFLLYPDFSAIDGETVLFALGQSFFALSVGVSVMVTLSSYASKKQNLPASAMVLAVMNIFVALLAGLVIFPGVFTFGFTPEEGPTLIFAVLPAIFEQMAFGQLPLIAFFVLFLFAALSTAFSLLEIIVAAFVRGNQTKRKRASWIFAILVFIVGVPSALSYGLLSNLEIGERSFFDTVDYVTSNILMPLGALLICLMIPRKISKEILWQEFTSGSNAGKRLFALWFALIKYVVPLAICIVFIDQLFGLNLVTIIFG
ncbi:sodium-dependent transporter [Alkalicoccobacillus murimartini]|uniref:Transporter n=1 Tax=Alkalicoccobacillus murimartini TaxID=171685 RepID=A0ABT9YID6_9BACI|nr:sodium-dependent transporter [Alkalicoccobacillus murimartini]MDQ0207255.1 NSS family neurotransmitter:Na+ symporter [Alkalicoccobacillus murimartini]